MVLHVAFAFDQVGYTRRRPQAGFITQCLGPALEPALDAPQVFWMQARLSSRPSGFLQRPQSTVLELPIPATDRLAVYVHLTGHLCLRDSLPQQFRRLKATLF